MDSVIAIVEKYEVPKEYFDAIWEAYEAGTKRGFVTAGIAAIAPPLSEEGKTV